LYNSFYYINFFQISIECYSLEMIPKDQVESILSKVNLKAVVSQYTSLSAKGPNLVGECPFCYSSAFTLSSGKKIFQCFRCKKGGNVVNFIKEMEDLNFIEAIAFIQLKYSGTIGYVPSFDKSMRGTVYVLELENSHYYIGFTRQFDIRMTSHFNGRGALWTKKHKPVSVLKAHYNKTLEYENILTEKYIMEYGYNKVRGGDHIFFHHKYSS
jgi:predicted GIY-YIG superfamily endonuclease